ncbi:SCO family protein [Leptospira broomii]|nr:SCO family protein [Leptospira broomii]
MKRTIIILLYFLVFLKCSQKRELGPVIGSLTDLNSVWETDQGKSVTFHKFIGEKFILSVFYTSCKTVCPLVVRNLKEMDQNRTFLNEKIVLVDIDAKDKTTDLENFRKREELNDRWILIHGKEPDIRELAAVLDINYRSNGSEIEHTIGKFEVSEDGQIRKIIEKKPVLE